MSGDDPGRGCLAGLVEQRRGALALVGTAVGLADAEIDGLVVAIYSAREQDTRRRVDLQP